MCTPPAVIVCNKQQGGRAGSVEQQAITVCAHARTHTDKKDGRACRKATALTLNLRIDFVCPETSPPARPNREVAWCLCVESIPLAFSSAEIIAVYLCAESPSASEVTKQEMLCCLVRGKLPTLGQDCQNTPAPECVTF